MPPNSLRDLPWILVDIGNCRCKLAVVEPGDDDTFFGSRIRMVGSSFQFSPQIVPSTLQEDSRSYCWWIGSVDRATRSELASWLKRERPEDVIHDFAFVDFPLDVRVQVPEQVGIDRLAAAAAAGAVLKRNETAVVVDAGTAVTVDLVTREADGAVFHGGAILSGPRLLAMALAAGTDALPEVSVLRYPQPALGNDTRSAISAGLYWGLIGSVKELVHQHRLDVGSLDRVFLTGGESAPLKRHLGQAVDYEPELVLRGLQMAARLVSARGESRESPPR